ARHTDDPSPDRRSPAARTGGEAGREMSRDDRPNRDPIASEKVTVSNMWEIAAIVEVMERKDLCTKQDLYDIITEFRRKNLRAKIPETAFPEPVPPHRD